MAAQAAFGLPAAFVADIEPGPCKILAHHHPDVPNLGDVRGIDWAPWHGRIKVLTGGFPCQDVSLAGLRGGLRRGENRSGLWSEMHRAIVELAPRFVVIENVRGILSAEAYSDVEPCPWCMGDEQPVALRALGAVLGDLADAGYDARWCGLRASDVGACHGRFRVFILAEPSDAASGGLPVIPRGDAGEDQVIDEPGAVGRGSDLDATSGVQQLERGQTAPAGEGMNLEDASAVYLPTPRATDGTKGGPNRRGASGDLMLPSAVHRLPTPEANLGTNGGSQHPDKRAAGGHSVSLQDVIEHVDFGKYAAAVERHTQVLGRSAPDPTEPAPRGGRRLNPKFVEWMMCIPEGWITDVPDLTRNEQLRALGNGVVPPQAVAAIRNMLPSAPRWSHARTSTQPTPSDTRPSCGRSRAPRWMGG